MTCWRLDYTVNFFWVAFLSGDKDYWENDLLEPFFSMVDLTDSKLSSLTGYIYFAADVGDSTMISFTSSACSGGVYGTTISV